MPSTPPPFRIVKWSFKTTWRSRLKAWWKKQEEVYHA